LRNLLQNLGLSVPFIQAPTGSIAGPELCIAVSNAGALGAMSLTWADPPAAAERVHQVRLATQKPFHVNYALYQPPVSLEAALDAGAPIVTLSWGDAAPYAERIHRAGALLGVQVSNLSGAQRAVQAGADFLVCQGAEAGGHVQSTQSLWDLLPRMVSTIGDFPVIAAGGIGNGAGIARALSLGAGGAMLGTRFVATQESLAHPLYKQRLLDAKADHAALTVCFDGSWPYAAHRVLRNRTLEQWEAFGCPPHGLRPGEGDILATTVAGEPILRYEDTAPRIGMTGEVSEMALYAGTSCGLIEDLPPAAALVARLWAECQNEQGNR
jgi:nitronate monooxygenase